MPATLFENRLWHWCFSVNFTKFLRPPFFKEHFRWLLLMLENLAPAFICHKQISYSDFINSLILWRTVEIVRFLITSVSQLEWFNRFWPLLVFAISFIQLLPIIGSEKVESPSYSAIVKEGFGPKVIYCSSNSSSDKGVLRKRCYENMQQIYRRTPTLKCHFNKVALQLWRDASVTSLTTINMYQRWAFVKMELLVKIESGFQPLTIFTKSSILEVWKGFEITLRHGCSAVNLMHIFRTLFLKNTSGRLFLHIWHYLVSNKNLWKNINNISKHNYFYVFHYDRIIESFRNSRTRLDIKLRDYNKTLKAGLTFEGQFEQEKKPFPYILRVVSSEVFTMNISLPNITIADGKLVIQRTKMDISNGGLKIPIFCFYSYMKRVPIFAISACQTESILKLLCARFVSQITI